MTAAQAKALLELIADLYRLASTPPPPEEDEDDDRINAD